jgi:aspartate/methionine/tyrosine aminotransferase
MKISDKIESIEGSKTVAFTALIQRLRQEGKEIIDLAVVPGEAFGMATHMRISFAVSDENLKNGLDRIAGVL